MTKNNPSSLAPHHHSWRNITLFFSTIIFAVLFSQSLLFSNLLISLNHFPLVAAFIAGILFASTFTVALGGLIIINLTQTLFPIYLIIFATLGAVACDAFIFIFFKHHITNHASSLYQQLNHHNHLKKIVHTRYFAWTLPVIGAFIIASPLPDEIGVSLLGLSNTTFLRFFLISFFCHILGITTIIGGSRFF